MDLLKNWQNLAAAIIKMNHNDTSFINSRWCEWLKDLCDIKEINIETLYDDKIQLQNIAYKYRVPISELRAYLVKENIKVWSEINPHSRWNDLKWYIKLSDKNKVCEIAANADNLGISKVRYLPFFNEVSFVKLTHLSRKEFLEIAKKLNIDVVYSGNHYKIDYTYKDMVLKIAKEY